MKLVAFKIGKGNRYKKSGHLSFLGYSEIGNFINNLILSNDKFFTKEGQFTQLITTDVFTGIGRIVNDSENYIIYTKPVDNCNTFEKSLIK